MPLFGNGGDTAERDDGVHEHVCMDYTIFVLILVSISSTLNI